MIVSSDLERSKAFYRDVLDLKVGTDAVPHWVDFDLGDGHMLGVHPTTDKLTVGPGSQQLGFLVDDVDAFVTGARAAGVPILQDPRDENFGRLAIIADPDGYAVQVMSTK